VYVDGIPWDVPAVEARVPEAALTDSRRRWRGSSAARPQAQNFILLRELTHFFRLCTVHSE
jgi:hypothetical protein